MVDLIKMGLAYADNTPAEEMKEQRDAGIESKHRVATMEVNLEHFNGMCSGKVKGFCMRAKMDM